MLAKKVNINEDTSRLYKWQVLNLLKYTVFPPAVEEKCNLRLTCFLKVKLLFSFTIVTLTLCLYDPRCHWHPPGLAAHHEAPGRYWVHGPPPPWCPLLSTTASTSPAAVGGKAKKLHRELLKKKTEIKHWFLLEILASTISPLLTVSSLLFLELKSFITRMYRGFDSPELKKHIKGRQKLEILNIQSDFMYWCIPWFCLGTWWSPLGWILHRKSTRYCYAFSSVSFSPVHLSVCPSECLMFEFTRLGAGRGLSTLFIGSLGSGVADTSGGCQPSKNSSLYVGKSSSSSCHLVLEKMLKS